MNDNASHRWAFFTNTPQGFIISPHTKIQMERNCAGSPTRTGSNVEGPVTF